MKSKCFIVSNRLPFNYCLETKTLKPSSGGLVSAIKGIKGEKIDYDFEWIGTVDEHTPQEVLDVLNTQKFQNTTCHPVPVSSTIYEKYYEGYCNSVLWPLLHYEHATPQVSLEEWEAYSSVNELIALELLGLLKEGDIVWVHDYHLFLLPALIKKKSPHTKVGFFLHIPFPCVDYFRELPQREEILNSLLVSDLIGFHDLNYLNNFSSCVQGIVGRKIRPLEDKQLGVYPISIDTKFFEDLAEAPETLNSLDKFLTLKGNSKWILGVDRLDYIKGLYLKLKSFERFLELYPEAQGSVTLVQVVIPSRATVAEYQNLKLKIEQLVSSINGKFGTLTYEPIKYLYNSVTPSELSALYQAAEVLYVGSRRDGMNLVSLEYVASQSTEAPGALLLSEFAGSHSSLSYALSINPWNIEETATKIHEAINLKGSENHKHILSMKNFLRKYSSTDWACHFLDDLVKAPSANAQEFKWEPILKGRKKIVFCDLDGTLLPIEETPQSVKFNEETIELLTEISKNPEVEFILLSGRDSKFLEEEFISLGLPLSCAACHGSLMYDLQKKEWVDLLKNNSIEWKEKVKHILQSYTDRVPGSFIEEKEYSVVWHYRQSPSEFAEFMSKRIFRDLEETLSCHPVEVGRGQKIIEIKDSLANKGAFARRFIKEHSGEVECLLALGDDESDEALFESVQHLGLENYCIKVGSEPTKARYRLAGPDSVRRFLSQLSKT